METESSSRLLPRFVCPFTRQLSHQARLAQEQLSEAPNLLVARAVAGQDGLNSFSIFLADARSDFQRAKSREFSVTSVASVRVASDAISRSRKWLEKSICPKVLRERRTRMPVSIQAEPGGEEKWPKARCARQSSSRARFSCWLWVPA